jgi:hypothetical protein
LATQSLPDARERRNQLLAIHAAEVRS